MATNGKTRKEFKIDTEGENFKISCGTLDKTNPSVIYLKFDTWANYSGDSKTYKENIDILNSNVRNKLKSQLRGNKMFDVSFLYTPVMKKSFFSNKPKFHACFEFTLKQKQPINTNIEEIKNEIQTLSSTIIKDIERSAYFSFSLSK